MDDMAFAQYYLSRRHILDYASLSATALFIYDYILTLHLEIKFIWHSPWTYTKVIYLLIRYLGLIEAMLYSIHQIFLNVPMETCKEIFPMSMWLVMIQISLAEGILCIRTWAVWRRNKVIGIGLTFIMLAFMIVHIILTKRLIQPMRYSPPLYSGFRGCFVTKAPSDLWENVAPVIVVEFNFVLMVASAFNLYRQGFNGELSHVIHRDGILFYIYLLCISAVNLAVTIALPIGVSAVLLPLQNTLYAVLSIRIILNIREVNNKGLQTELHTGHYDSLVFAVPSGDVHHQGGTDLSQSWTNSWGAD